MNAGTNGRGARIWGHVLRWLLPVIAFAVMAGAVFTIFMTLKSTIWCYFTDDVSIRENALSANVRMVLWEEPHGVGGEMSRAAGLAAPSFYPDERTVVFSRQMTGKTNTDLYTAAWDGYKWSAPVPLEQVNTGSNQVDPSITHDGRYLYFSSDRSGGCGGYDIWIARWNGQNWIGITNAGPAINTEYDERCPAVSPDGRRLYFSSKKPLADAEVKARSTFFSKASPDAGHDIFSADIEIEEPAKVTAASSASNAVVASEAPLVKVQAGKAKAAGKKKSKPGKAVPVTSEVNVASTNLPPVPEFNDVAREEILCSPADDLYVRFTARGDFLYLASDRKGGLGGFDLYFSRVVNGNPGKPQNLGSEINAAADDICPALRMAGFDLLYSLNGEQEEKDRYVLDSSTTREVVSRLDLSRLDSLIARILEVKWWILVFILGVALLVYLIKHYKDLTSLFHKCLMMSAIVHVALVLMLAFFKVSSAIVREEEAAPKTQMEVAVNVEALAREKLALDMAENVTIMPPSEITVIATKSGGGLPVPDFNSPKKSVQTVVARSTVSSVLLENAPSKAQNVEQVEPQENKLPAAPVLPKLPELSLPRLDVVMEAGDAVKNDIDAKLAEEFRPVTDMPQVSAGRVEVTVTGIVSRLSAVKPATGPGNVAKAGPVSNATMVAADTGGNVVRLSGGGDESSGPQALKGPGTTVSMQLTFGGGGGVFKVNLPGQLDVPAGFGTAISPYQVRKSGKPSIVMVEGLGGNGTTENAVGRGLEWLTRHQEQDGRWDIQKYGGEQGHDVAATSLSLLCYLGWGIKHNEPGVYQGPAAKAVEWLKKQVKSDGNAMGAGGNMYDQGIAGIAMGEAYGLTKDPALGTIVSNMVAFVVKAQHKNGGWRYQPGQEGDMSVTGWQIMALKSAEMAGVEVPKDAFERAEGWLTSVGGGENGGICGYTDKNNRQPGMAAEGMFCRQILAVAPEDLRMLEGAGFLKTTLLSASHVDYYYWYYGTLAMYQHRGTAWETWNERLKEVLPDLQVKTGDEAGSWNPAGQQANRMGRVVTTALATLSMEVYYRYLPFYFSKNVEKTDTKVSAQEPVLKSVPEKMKPKGALKKKK